MRRHNVQALLMMLLMTVAATVIAAGCGGKSGPTPEQRLTSILGHAPTGLAATIAKRGTLVVANDANYAPQSFIDPKTHKITGFDVDVAKEVCTILGLKPSFKQVAWETIPAGLRLGRFDVSIGSMPIPAAGSGLMNFTAPYYYTTGQVMIRQGGQAVTSVADLAGKRVGVVIDTVFFSFLRQYSQIRLVTYPTDNALFAALAGGNIDAAMAFGPSEKKAIAAGGAFEMTGPPLYYQDLGFAVRKREPDFVSVLDYAIARMHRDGSLSRLSKKWYSGLDLSVNQ